MGITLVAMGTFGINPQAIMASAATVPTEIHQQCLAAVDYKGCVEMNTQPDATSSTQPEECDANGWCIAQAGSDRFGLPKREGWKQKFLASDNTVRYLDPQDRYVAHKGRSDRYFTTHIIVHDLEPAVAAKPGYYRTVSEAKTTCTEIKGYNNTRTTTCRTQPPNRIWVPGTAGTPGGPRVRSFNIVYDCLDLTQGNYWAGQLRGNWTKVTSNKSIGYVKSTCETISDLPKSSLRL